MTFTPNPQPLDLLVERALSAATRAFFTSKAPLFLIGGQNPEIFVNLKIKWLIYFVLNLLILPPSWHQELNNSCDMPVLAQCSVHSRTAGNICSSVLVSDLCWPLWKEGSCRSSADLCWTEKHCFAIDGLSLIDRIWSCRMIRWNKCPGRAYIPGYTRHQEKQANAGLANLILLRQNWSAAKAVFIDIIGP